MTTEFIAISMIFCLILQLSINIDYSFFYSKREAKRFMRQVKETGRCPICSQLIEIVEESE